MNAKIYFKFNSQEILGILRFTMEIPESRMVPFPTYLGQLNIMFPKRLISQETQRNPHV